MALFTDGSLSQESDLEDHESSILSVAQLEGVDAGAKRRLAQEDIASQIELFLLRDPWLDPQAPHRRREGLFDVIVSASLRRWHAELSIALIYSDAYSNQLNDRYLVKLTQYQGLVRESAIRYFLTGVGLVHDPVPKAAVPTLTAVEGAVSSATYYFAVAWLNAKGQEGAPSDVANLMTSAGSVPMLSMAWVPHNAQGWSIYGGADPSALALQSSGPLTLPVTLPLSWTLPVSGLTSGRPPGHGQTPELFIVNESKIQRG